MFEGKSALEAETLKLNATRDAIGWSLWTANPGAPYSFLHADWLNPKRAVSFWGSAKMALCLY